VLVEVLEDEAMTTGSQGMKLCVSCASDLFKHLDTLSVDDTMFVGWLVGLLRDIVSGKFDSVKFWLEFRKQHSSKGFFHQIGKMLT